MRTSSALLKGTDKNITLRLYHVGKNLIAYTENLCHVRDHVASPARAGLSYTARVLTASMMVLRWHRPESLFSKLLCGGYVCNVPDARRLRAKCKSYGEFSNESVAAQTVRSVRSTSTSALRQRMSGNTYRPSDTYSHARTSIVHLLEPVRHTVNILFFSLKLGFHYPS